MGIDSGPTVTDLGPVDIAFDIPEEALVTFTSEVVHDDGISHRAPVERLVAMHYSPSRTRITFCSIRCERLLPMGGAKQECSMCGPNGCSALGHCSAHAGPSSRPILAGRPWA